MPDRIAEDIGDPYGISHQTKPVQAQMREDGFDIGDVIFKRIALLRCIALPAAAQADGNTTPWCERGDLKADVILGRSEAAWDKDQGDERRIAIRMAVEIMKANASVLRPSILDAHGLWHPSPLF